MGEDAFRAAACRIARERAVFTWTGTVPGPTPSVRLMEFTVGDATLGFRPAEAAEIIGELAR